MKRRHGIIVYAMPKKLRMEGYSGEVDMDGAVRDAAVCQVRSVGGEYGVGGRNRGKAMKGTEMGI